MATLAMVGGFGIGCRSLPPLPPADLSGPGWRVQQGQAVWKPTARRPELAGELLLATNTNGDCFVQFVKTPFTLATAQRTGARWHIEFGGGAHSAAGHGRPPARFVWFQVPGAVQNGGCSGHWRWSRLTTNTWRLKNARTGESLQGAFFP